MTKPTLIMEGSFDDFSLAEVLEVTSLSRQLMKVVLWFSDEVRGAILLKSGQLIDARQGKDLGGLDALLSLYNSHLERFQVFRLSAPSKLGKALGSVADMLKRVVAAEAEASAKVEEAPRMETRVDADEHTIVFEADNAEGSVALMSMLHSLANATDLNRQTLEGLREALVGIERAASSQHEHLKALEEGVNSIASPSEETQAPPDTSVHLVDAIKNLSQGRQQMWSPLILVMVFLQVLILVALALLLGHMVGTS